MRSIYGNDISKWQGQANAATMKAAGSRFIGIKCGQGYSIDPRFAETWASAKGILPRFAYWFWDDSVNTRQQVNTFTNTITIDGGELPPCLDLEDMASREKLLLTIREFYPALAELSRERKPLLYTNVNFVKNILAPIPQDILDTWDLFIASYPYIPDTSDPINFIQRSTIEPRTGQFPSWRFWQFSADGNKQGARFGVESRDIDIDLFNGGEAEWAAYLGEVAPVELTDKEKLDILWAEYKGRS